LKEGEVALAWQVLLAAMRAIREVALVGAAYSLYAFGRDMIYNNGLFSAFDNARQIVHLEQTLGIFREMPLQQWFLRNAEGAIPFFNWFYIVGYWPVIIPTAVFLYLHNREAYLRLRNIAFLTFGIALVLFETFPLAPPRMFANLGFVDTLQLFGPKSYLTTSDATLYNPYAAMPSMHFGLVFLISTAWFGSRLLVWKLAAAAYVGLMLAAIVITGNHYFVDAMAAVVAVGLSFLICASFASLRRRVAVAFTPGEYGLDARRLEALRLRSSAEAKAWLFGSRPPVIW
jgi:hypothetical protein